MRPQAGRRNDLYTVTNEGSVVKITNTDRVSDSLVGSVGSEDTAETDVPSSFLGRQLVGPGLPRHRWTYLESRVRADDGSAGDGTFSLLTEDPDTETEIVTISDTLGAEIVAGNGSTIRARCGNLRGYGAQVKFVPTVGRPRLSTAKVTAMTANRQTLSQN